jgi:hypothetical protein
MIKTTKKSIVIARKTGTFNNEAYLQSTVERHCHPTCRHVIEFVERVTEFLSRMKSHVGASRCSK